jgi:predicted HAD superfamily Cof-like phosphohydrolase
MERLNDMGVTVLWDKRCKKPVIETEVSDWDPNMVIFTLDSTNIAVHKNDVDKFHSEVANAWNMTNASKVKEFTEGSMGKSCPATPQPMTREAIKFIVRMVLSEMTELAQTVCESPEEAVRFVADCVGADTNMTYTKPTDEVSLIAEQNDAFVDAWYYMLNCAAKHGVNLSAIFDVVHGANMAKRGPDGKFHRRPEDGKVIKPDNWKEPDIAGEIRRQMNSSEKW